MRTIIIVWILAIAFLAGMLASDLIAVATAGGSDFSGKEMATVIRHSTLFSIITGSPVERESPMDRIKDDDIALYNKAVMFKVDNPILASFADTNSMDPILDSESNAIEVVPESPEDIKEGDIVSFAYGDSTIIHRVIKKGIDEKGVFFLTKGDNNPNIDPLKVRFKDVKRVVVAIIY